jgi:HEAT repeat protein
VDALLDTMLKSKHVDARRRAVTILNGLNITDKRVVVSLAATLKDEDGGVRMQAISGLQQLSLSSKPAAAEIRKALADSNFRVRQVAYYLLSSFGEKPIETLRASLKSDNVRERLTAASLLATQGQVTHAPSCAGQGQ